MIRFDEWCDDEIVEWVEMKISLDDDVDDEWMMSDWIEVLDGII